MARLTLLDETASGSLLHRLKLEVAQQTLPVGELLARRVHEEVAARNAHLTNMFQGLGRPVGSQRVGNSYYLAEPHLLDAEEQTYCALEAFRQNRFLSSLMTGRRKAWMRKPGPATGPPSASLDSPRWSAGAIICCKRVVLA